VFYLGLGTIRSLVLSIQIFSQFEGKTMKGFSLNSLAQHCWLTGVLSRRIAELEHSNAKMGDQCFLAGLLHDTGKLILAAGMPDQYARVLETARSENKTLWEAERAEFGATHAEVGG